MPDEIVYRPDLYRGIAGDYDRFRVGYPKAMLDDLVTRSALTGRGRLLDLACGTGQITFALHGHFAEVWSVDQEPDMVELVRAKAATAGMSHIRAVASPAEEFTASAETFELVAVGNAFHRLQRQAVASKVLRWLQPGQCCALLWADGPWRGTADWQQAMAATLDTWTDRAGTRGLVPLGWDQDRVEYPDGTVLEASGFEPVGSYAFPHHHEWTIEALIGFAYSTSFLPRTALGDLADAFEADLRNALGATDPAVRFHETINFGYELARRHHSQSVSGSCSRSVARP